MLEVRNCSKRFGGIKALENVSFRIEKGEVLGIIGPNGAGKTTLFNIISGIYRPDEGRILFENEDITGKPPYKIARLGIARTFQMTTLFSNITVIGNIMIALAGYKFRNIFDAIKNFKEETLINEAIKLLEFLQLSELALKPVYSISQEARKRLSIGVAIVTKPKLLLLDEPTAGLNFEETSKILEIIKKLKEIGITIALVEHKMRFIRDLSDQILVLERGRVVAKGKPDDIFRNEEVIKAYLGERYVT